ncbi:MAG: hypothetical protein KKF50_00260 [Nanoarchaeota archaeon]|nr:hypothetical protein [Nanoarchaeota archaeon]
MKGVIASLFIFIMMFSFAIAGSSSSIRTDFYIQDEVTTGGYEEDANVVVGGSDFQQSEWLSKVIYLALIIILVAILIRVLPMVSTGAKAKPRTKRKAKRSRRKK